MRGDGGRIARPTKIRSRKMTRRATIFVSRCIVDLRKPSRYYDVYL